MRELEYSRINEYEFKVNSLRSRSNLDQDESNLICKYLKNPIKSGIWQLSLRKTEKCEIIEDILKELNVVTGQKENEKYPNITRLKRVLKREGTGFKNYLNRYTSIFSLFTFICVNQEDMESSEINIRYSMDRTDALIFKEIDIKKILKKYNKEYLYFKNNIFHEEINTRITLDKLRTIKNGFFIYSSDDGGRDAFFRSLKKDTLEKLKIFLEMILRVDNAKIRRIHTPEEEVFKPYIIMLKKVEKEIISDKSELRLVKKAISEYEGENLSNSISSIGLASEECLVQIYESLFFNSAPKIALGKLYQLIHEEIERRLPPSSNIPSSENIERVLAKIKSSSSVEKKEYESIINLLSKRILDSEKYLKKIIEEAKDNQFNPRYKISIFPKDIKENLGELIGLRNIVSHRSRVRIGEHDVIRAFYDFVSLVLWWQTELEQINWDCEQEEIIAEIIQRSK